MGAGGHYLCALVFYPEVQAFESEPTSGHRNPKILIGRSEFCRKSVSTPSVSEPRPVGILIRLRLLLRSPFVQSRRSELRRADVLRKANSSDTLLVLDVSQKCI